MAELHVSRKTIHKLFSEMKEYKYIIPDYQRPYKWDQEKCDILWDDITTFFLENKDKKEYFLGTIVTCKGDDQKDEDGQKKIIEIIDGQQRITSLFLLLRAFYSKLETMPVDVNISGLMNQIAPCIWDVDSISGQVKDKHRIHIESTVATEKDNEVFHNILYTGSIHKENKDLFSTNYTFFSEKCDDFAKTNPLNWQPLCVFILHNCIVLPIECENRDTALTIFSTLNDRGLPLSDSDIFKAQFYKAAANEESKKLLTGKWKELTETAENAKISLDDLFRYHTHYLRAKIGDKSKEIGLRKFYSLNNYSKFKENGMIDDLKKLSGFWFVANTRKSRIDEDEPEKINPEAQKYLHCLQCYPNEYWKYITSVYYYKNHSSAEFLAQFPGYLKKIAAFLYVKFIEKPTVNAIKDDIFQGCIDIFQKGVPKYSYSLDDKFLSSISNAKASKAAKGLILLQAYQNPKQKDLIPSNFEIEHIFPRVWQNTNYNGWNEEDAVEYLEYFRNKVAIEKKLNIRAGNGYFGKKKQKYAAQSKIAEVLELGGYSKDDWVKEDIIQREKIFATTLLTFFRENLR